MKIDLHCHTRVSDGVLTPSELLERALEQQVSLLAITDHDTVDAYQQLPETPALTLITGVEISAQWGSMGVHIVGLNVDLNNASFQTQLKQQQVAREQRAEAIAERLVKKGLPNLLEDVKRLADGSQIGRPHFAEAMLERGIVNNQQAAFKRHLGAGKAGDVKAQWPHMSEAIEWIVASGGIAVLAHPLHYKITQTKRRALISDFKAAGGEAMEVISGSQSQAETTMLAKLCETYSLKASCGSDFHRPNPWSELGIEANACPSICEPVWQNWI